MKRIVNVQESIGKTVGKRRPGSDSFQTAMVLQETMIDLQRAVGRKGLVPKGVYRFHSHEEAETWMTRMLARPS